MVEIETGAGQTPEDEAAILAILSQHSDDSGQSWNPQPFVHALKEDGRVVGGIYGNINNDWLFVHILAVDASLRGQGWGEKLMARAEAQARENNCKGMWLDTFTFQAPGFYKKLGFEVFGSLPEAPGDQTRFFFRKLLR